MDGIEGTTELKSPCCFSVREVERRDLCFLVHVLEITSIISLLHSVTQQNVP